MFVEPAPTELVRIGATFRMGRLVVALKLEGEVKLAPETLLVGDWEAAK